MNSDVRAFVYNVMQATEKSVEELGVLASLTDNEREAVLIAGQLRGIATVLEHIENELNQMEQETGAHD